MSPAALCLGTLSLPRAERGGQTEHRGPAEQGVGAGFRDPGCGSS